MEFILPEGHGMEFILHSLYTRKGTLFALRSCTTNLHPDNEYRALPQLHYTILWMKMTTLPLQY